MQKKWVAIALILLLGAVWGSSFILIKQGLVSFKPLQVAGLRLFLAGLVLTPWLYRYSWGSLSTNNGVKTISKRDYLNLFLSGLIGNGIPAALFSYAGTTIPSGLSGILNAFTPVCTILWGHFYFHTKTGTNGWLGVFLGISGVVIILLPGLMGVGHINLLGAGMALSAAFMYGYNIHIIKNRLGHLPVMVKTVYPFVFMAACYSLVLLFTKIWEAWETHPQQASTSLGYLLILGIVGSALSMVVFNWLIKHTTALISSTNTLIIPVVAVIWGTVIHEELSIYFFIGLALILLSIYLIVFLKPKSAS